MAEEKITEELEETAENAEVAEEKTPETDEQPAEEVKDEAAEKLREWEDKYFRLFAEFDNFKKRSAREKDARYADAVIDTAGAMLDVLDNLQRALTTEVASDDAKALYDGVALVEKQMKEVLAKLEITEIPALGEQFDPNVHNAVMHIEDETVDDNTVVEEFMKGYIYKDSRVLRHSMVKVAN